MTELNFEELKENIDSQDVDEQPKQKSKLIVGVIGPPFLMLVMFLVYQLFGLVFGREFGWYMGLFVYWILCGLLFSTWLIGIKKIKKISTPRRLKLKMIPFILIPVLISFIGKFFSGLGGYDTINLLSAILLVITAFGNGTFEEILWRGAYMELYPNNKFMRIFYSTFWYAVFHFASGSLSSNSNILVLVIGAAFFGIYLAFLAKWTNTIWWGILCHILGGLIVIA
ncbi:MAG: CPBP family intramembrane glutamic endopeptidase [Promethearchaeota archaeon]